MGPGHTEPTCEAVAGRLQRCQCCLSHFSCSCAQFPAAVPDGSKSVCLSCSGAGVCTDNHNRGGDDGDGGGDHVSAEPLQALCALLHQPAQPGQAAGREPLLSKSHPAPPATPASFGWLWHHLSLLLGMRGYFRGSFGSSGCCVYGQP